MTFRDEVNFEVRGLFFHLSPIRVRNRLELYFFRGRITLCIRHSLEFLLSSLQVFVKNIGDLLTNDHEPKPHHMNLNIKH